MKRLLGFTLIELMVAVAIIGILAAMTIPLYANSQRKARDSKRINDISAIAKVLEINFDSCQTGMYCPLQPTDFAGRMPTDTTTAKYCMNTSPSAGPPPEWPTSWARTDECPTPGYTSNLLTGVGFPRPRWILCARLESSTGDTTGTGLKLFCRTPLQ